jgi:hypothetical protein
MSASLATIERQSTALAQLDKARQMLAESRTLSEVKKIRDIAEAAKVYAKAAKLGRETQNIAAEICILATCKAGEILKQLDKSKGGYAKDAAASVAGASEYAKTLEETGTAERTAQYWQKIAEVPEESRAAYFARVHSTDNGEITVTGLLRAAPHAEKRKHRSEPPDNFEVLRKLALRALNIGFAELKKTNTDSSHLAAAKDWARCKLEAKETA